jgi:hypothetical protein
VEHEAAVGDSGQAVAPRGVLSVSTSTFVGSLALYYGGAFFLLTVHKVAKRVSWFQAVDDLQELVIHSDDLQEFYRT